MGFCRFLENFQFFAFRGKGKSAENDDFCHRGKSCVGENSLPLKAISHLKNRNLPAREGRVPRQRGKSGTQPGGLFANSATYRRLPFSCQRGKS